MLQSKSEKIIKSFNSCLKRCMTSEYSSTSMRSTSRYFPTGRTVRGVGLIQVLYSIKCLISKGFLFLRFLLQNFSRVFITRKIISLW